ncbi:hypothetical protein V1477_000904 [Vespula maculifrons]|uniref:Uncharacterized protein n=1 Tax=Vespula maculifrons TaxID=7453 RepID=A0ABD2D0C4_VESMC
MLQSPKCDFSKDFSFVEKRYITYKKTSMKCQLKIANLYTVYIINTLSLFRAKSIGYIKVFAIKPAILPDIIELNCKPVCGAICNKVGDNPAKKTFGVS